MFEFKFPLRTKEDDEYDRKKKEHFIATNNKISESREKRKIELHDKESIN